MKVEETVAGPELDALVAEKVMGLTVCRCPGNGLAVWMSNGDAVHMPGCGKMFSLRFSTDIAAAWEVLVRAFPVAPDDKSGFPMIMHRDDGWIVTMAYRDGTPMGVVGGGRLSLSRADSAPLAICRAALKAVGA